MRPVTKTAAKAPAVRLSWLDGMKAIAILWIAFFHFFEAWVNDRYPGVLSAGYFASFLEGCAPASPAETVGCVAASLFVAITRVGFHAVAVFLILSGFGLTFSLARTGEPAGGWISWYRSRLLRLFPMYWLAHLLYLISPFVSRPESIDYRFWLSFLGDRIWPVHSIFYYFNPALWYFGLLLELYLVFPILYRALRRLGPAGFLLLAAAVTFGSRYLMLVAYPVHGYYTQGAFFAPRLWEFALGMALGLQARRDPQRFQRLLFSPAALVVGAALYTAGLYSYASLLTYVFADALTGTGLFVILARVARATDRVPAVGPMLAYVGLYSYGLYLLHQPYVIWFGSLASTRFGLGLFVPYAVTVIAVITLAATQLERGVNGAVNRVLR